MIVMFYGSFLKFKLLFFKLRYKYRLYKLSKEKAKTEPEMNQTQTPMIINDNNLKVEEINAYHSRQESSVTNIS